ncbi:MAG: carbamoyltransferase family protein, partial [Vicinamibacterales bacterium]
LGINSAYHESAAALVVDGRVTAAAEEERFNRTKHGKRARVDNPHDLPVAAIEYCLSTAGVLPGELDAVCYSFDPARRRDTFRFDPHGAPGDWGDRLGERTFLECLAKTPGSVSSLLGVDLTRRFHWVPHHMAHAALAYYASGFDRAAVLVADGIGESSSTMTAAAAGATIRPIAEIEFPDSIGFLWEKICRFLGFTEYDACKVMGLAAYGDAAAARAGFARFVHVSGGRFAIDNDILELRRETCDGLSAVLGPPRRPQEPLDARHAAVAAALQEVTNRIMLGLVENLYQQCPALALCLSGGVALNCTTNWVLKEQGPFREIFIPSAPHDAGTAPGAALFVYYRGVEGTVDRSAMDSPYLGPEFSDEAMARAIQEAGISATPCPAIGSVVADMLAQGAIVGWFDGRLEFGPRALGHRSLLADPRVIDSRIRMNEIVKRREPFRPFAPSVLKERAAEWFELGRPSRSASYMLFTCPARAHRAPIIPAVVHRDRTARIQLVDRAETPAFHQLISEFDKLTGVPLVLNTSFNDSEPIVCSPADAITTFQRTPIDALALGPYLLTQACRPVRVPIAVRVAP